MRDWLVIAAVGLGTYAARAAFLVAVTAELPPVMTRALGYVAPAVLAAIALPALLSPSRQLSVPDAVTGVAAGLTCWLVWRRTQSFPLALGAGLLAGLAAAPLVGVVS